MTTPSDASQAVELPPLSRVLRDHINYNTSDVIEDAILDYARAAIAQDRAARAQAEPVAWMTPDCMSVMTPDEKANMRTGDPEDDGFADRHDVALVRAAAARVQGAGEAVAERCKECGGIDIPWGLGKCCCPKIMKGRDDREHDGADAQGAAQGGRTDTGGSGEGAGPGENVGDEHRSAEAEAVGHSDYSLGDSVRLPDARAIQEAIDLTPEIEARPVGGFTPQWSAAPTIPQAAEVPGFVPATSKDPGRDRQIGICDEGHEPFWHWVRKAYRDADSLSTCFSLWNMQVAFKAGWMQAIAAAPTPTASAPKAEGEARLWLWKNGDHYLAFEHLYPCFTPGGDPMTLGEPAGVAIFKRSFDRKADRTREGGDVVASHPSPASTLICSRCGVDRFQVGCPEVNCAMVTQAQNSPQPKFYTGQQD